MDAHAHAQLASRRPGMFGEGALSSDRGQQCLSGGGKGDEEGVSLGVDLDAGVGGEGLSQEGTVLL
jgi:hypothetical protein